MAKQTNRAKEQRGDFNTRVREEVASRLAMIPAGQRTDAKVAQITRQVERSLGGGGRKPKD